jgi:hypothetical protein
MVDAFLFTVGSSTSLGADAERSGITNTSLPERLRPARRIATTICLQESLEETNAYGQSGKRNLRRSGRNLRSAI